MSKQNNQNQKSIIEKNKTKEINLNKLPKNLCISTMTITCNFDTLINIENVGKYIDIVPDNIVYIKYGKNKIRSIVEIKKGVRKPKKKVNFYNQATIYIAINDRTIHMKLFQNGAIQITGCKTNEEFTQTITILCNSLRKKKAVYEKDNKVIVKKEFLSKYENVEADKLYNFGIGLINSNFKSGFMINRENLFELLLKKNITCVFEPCIHACVNIKHDYKNENTISIFVFESGSIIITGAKTQNQVMDSYKFIIKLLYENYDQVFKININDFLKKPEIKKLLDDNKLKSVKNKNSTVKKNSTVTSIKRKARKLKNKILGN